MVMVAMTWKVFRSPLYRNTDSGGISNIFPLKITSRQYIMLFVLDRETGQNM